MHTVDHALVLNFHQPAGNLWSLLETEPWQAHEILYAMDRMPRSLWEFEGIARVHLSLSGTLLETLADPAFQQKVYGIVDVGSLLWHLQNERLFKILGTAYYHAVLPLIPEDDRPAQIERWLGIARHLFWRDRFDGFWPPEMGFSMELIPLLKRYGYRYVLVDSEHVRPVTSMRWEELLYRPHVARYGEEEIIVVVRDRDLSNAQESGMEYGWFEQEVANRTRWCDFPPLVTTATDGDNGGWFRNTTEGANFWSAFYRELLQHAMHPFALIRPSFIDDYLDRHGAHGEVTVETGAWNTGWHHGRGFVQWTGSQAQRDALARVAAVSHCLHERKNSFDMQTFEQAYWRLLRAQTSCNFYWGEAWVDRCHADLDAVEQIMGS